jgi:predicted RNase H-like HicB family nuclease
MTTPPFSAVTNQPISPSPVLVTQQSEQVWIAKLLAWAGFAVEGNSREDALQKLDRQIKAQLADGEIAYLDLPLARTEITNGAEQRSQSPWIKYAGMFKDDPDFAEIAAAIRAERAVEDDTEVDPSVYSLES